MSDKYSINYSCNNCDHVGKTELPRGTKVPDVFMCPNCGCNTARKHVPVVGPYRLETSPLSPWPNQ